jgi:hypothetical protein
MLLSKIAALSDCIEGVNMRKVMRLRKAIRNGDKLPAILLHSPNKLGYHVVNDGNHRLLAHLLENKRNIEAKIDSKFRSPPLSWRWPRIAPVIMTKNLLLMTNQKGRSPCNS